MTIHAPTDARVVRDDASEESASGRGEVLVHVGQALDRGVVSTGDVERFLSRAETRGPDRGRPTAAVVLYAVGAVVVFGGLAIAYGTIFNDLPHGLQLTTPFLFPLASLAACLALERRHAAAWQVEVAGLVGYVALAAACVTVGRSAGWLGSDHDLAVYAAVCASISAALVIGLFAAIGSVRLLALGLGVTLSILGLSLADVAGVLHEGTVGWVVLAEAGAAAVAAGALARRDRRGCQYATYWALVGVWAASVAGISVTNPDHLSVWHVILAAGIITAFLVAGAMNFNGLIWLAALAGLQWLQSIAIVVGSATNAAFAVVLAGLGLVALGLLVTRLNHRTRPTP